MKPSLLSTRSVVAALVLGGCASSSSVEQQAATGAVAPVAAAPTTERGVFTVLRGTDTLGTERFTRTATQLDADFATRAQGRFAYTATLLPDATVSRVEVRAYRAGSAADAQPSQRSVAVFQGDSVAIEDVREGGQPQSSRLATQRQAIPYVNPSMSLMEQILRRARAAGSGSGSVQVPTFVASGGGQTVSATVTFLGADSAVVVLGPAEMRVRTDAVGRLLGAAVPAQGLVVERRDEAIP